MSVYEQLMALRAEDRKAIAWLIDPDKYDRSLVASVVNNGVVPRFIFVGGSLVLSDAEAVVADIKSLCPASSVVLFPGDHSQLAPSADALLLLSLISGRNPEFLIGQHVLSAYRMRKMGVPVIPTGYVLIDGGRVTSVEYVSGTRPIPADKVDIIVSTCLAGELLGLRSLYLEAGSGALHRVSSHAISAVRAVCSVPLIVGGGLRSLQAIDEVFAAGADVAVVGSIIEQEPALASRLFARYGVPC